MGKPRETASTDEESNVTSMETSTTAAIAQKRHKKHKHKRHKKKKVAHEDADGSAVYSSIAESERKKIAKVRGKKLEESKSSSDRIRSEKIIATTIGGRLSTNSASFVVGYGGATNATSGAASNAMIAAGSSSAIAGSTPPKLAAKKKIPKSGKGKDSGTSSEEERWLDAIESGKLEEVDDELKKIKPKDPKLMTARQRAMFERKTDAEPNPGVERLVSLPSGYKEKVMTAEAIQKAALKSQKRKQLADEKREKDKKKTMERLLKKQESKVSKLIGKGKAGKKLLPLISYTTNVQGSCISLPAGQDFPLCSSANLKENQIAAGRTEGVVRCSVEGCDHPKRYSCSKTGVPLCSLECYRANLAGILT